MENIRILFRQLLIVFLFWGCFSQDVPKATFIKYVENYRTILADSTIKDDKSAIVIGYLENKILYELPSIPYRVETVIEDGEEINKMYPTTDTVFRYFLLKKNEPTGLAYDSLASENPKVFKVDSLMHAIGIDKDNMAIFSVDVGKPSYVTAEKKHLRKEHYFSKVNEADADSIYRYYNDKLRGLQFSLSPLLDEKKRSKLWRTDLIYLPHERIDKNGKRIYVPRTEAIATLEEIRPKKQREILRLFQRFEKDRNN